MVFDVPSVYSSAVCVPSGMSVLMIKEPSFWVIDTCTGGFRRRLMLTPRLLGVPPVGGVLTGGGGVASSIPGAVKLTGRKPVVAAVGGDPIGGMPPATATPSSAVTTVAAWGALRGLVRVCELVGVIAQVRVELPFARQVDAARRRCLQPLCRTTGDPRSNQAGQAIEGQTIDGN